MPAPTKQAQPQPAAPQAAVPFLDGTYEYSEVINTQVNLLTLATIDLNPINILPGGYLRGVSIYVTSTGGTIGNGVVAADNPWNVISSITLESIDGTPILYPLGGYAAYLASRYTRHWDGDPALDPTFVATVNPAFRLRYFVESRASLGCLMNTDARAQYRIRLTLGRLSDILSTVGTATAPTVTVTTALEVYAQPPARTLTGAPIQPVPDGIAAQRFVSHQVDVTAAGTTTIKENRTGNLVRTLILVFRDSTGARIDLTGDPIRLRVDNTQLMVEQRTRRDLEMWRFYQWASQGPGAAVVRPTGVYVYNRSEDPGRMLGVGWLPTTEATLLQWEFNGAPAGGTLETITEDFAPLAALAPYLENV